MDLMSDILVIGCGYVGGTIADWLERKGHSVVRIDPKLNNNKIEDYENAVGAVICLPTPTIDGKPYDTAIKQIVNKLGDKHILIKSTILPDQLDNYADNVTYSPEFLRERHAKEDYENQKLIVWGGTRLEVGFWLTKFNDISKQNVVTNRATASMIKYIHNSWLATKVTFFHDLYTKLHKDVKYSELTGILGMFKNIGPSHMKAEKLGYDGSCFPKDVEAFTNFTGSEILKVVMEVNDNLLRAR